MLFPFKSYLNELKVGEAVKATPKANEGVVRQSDPPQIVAGKIERLKDCL
jgi:hypothetical protein